mgnify:FL=1
MKWFAVIVILVLLTVSAGFRKFATFLALTGIIGGFLIWQYQAYEENRPKTKILPSELIFEEVSLEPSDSDYELTGRIMNNSDKYTLSGTQMKLAIRDCSSNDKSDCITISEIDEYIYIYIPPRQARDFKKNIDLYSDINIQGELEVDYSIEYAEAR